MVECVSLCKEYTSKNIEKFASHRILSATNVQNELYIHQEYGMLSYIDPPTHDVVRHCIPFLFSVFVW